MHAFKFQQAPIKRSKQHQQQQQQNYDATHIRTQVHTFVVSSLRFLTLHVSMLLAKLHTCAHATDLPLVNFYLTRIRMSDGPTAEIKARKEKTNSVCK